MSRPTLFVLSGLPYAGKTTLGKRIAETLGHQLIAFDWIWAEMKPGSVPEVTKVDEWEEIYVIAFSRITRALGQGRSVVFDDISRRHEQTLRDLASQCGAAFKIIYLNLSREEAIRRRDANKTSKNRHHVASRNFYKVLDSYCPPSGDDVIECDPTTSWEDFVRKLQM